jgi:hypothetical protein
MEAPDVDERKSGYDRSRLRYPSDLTDAEWDHVAPVIQTRWQPTPY